MGLAGIVRSLGVKSIPQCKECILWEQMYTTEKARSEELKTHLYLKAGIVVEGYQPDINQVEFTQVRRVVTPSTLRNEARALLAKRDQATIATEKQKTPGEEEFEKSLASVMSEVEANGNR